jgi:hypothetical protein
MAVDDFRLTLKKETSKNCRTIFIFKKKYFAVDTRHDCSRVR